MSDDEEEVHPIIFLRDYLVTFSTLATELSDFLTKAIEHPDDIEDHEAWADELGEKFGFITAAFVSISQSMLGDGPVEEMLAIVNASIEEDRKEGA